MEYYLAFDVGGTTIKYAVIDNDLRIVRRGSEKTNNNTDNHILKTLKKSLSIYAKCIK